MKDNFDIRKFLLETFYDRKDIIILSEKGQAFVNEMAELVTMLNKAQKTKLEEIMNLQIYAHEEEMEKLVDWCVKILKK